MSKRNKIYLIILISSLCIDQISKFIVASNMELYESITMIPDFFSLTYVQNTGAAFSILEGRMEFFYFISVVALVVLVFFFKSIKSYQILSKIGVVLMIAGTIGNLIDRILFRYVIDFLDFIIFGYDFAVFNIADCCLVIGIIIVVIDELMMEFGVTYGKKIQSK